MLHPAIIVQ